MVPKDYCSGQLGLESLSPKLSHREHSTYLTQTREKEELKKRYSPLPLEANPTPPLSQLPSLADIERYALSRLSPKAVSYFASATEDEITKHANARIFRSILLRPRAFANVSQPTVLATNFVGSKVGLPIFVSPAALARLADAEAGEAGIARACAKVGALQMISNAASMRPEDIVSSAPRDSVFAWQLYIHKDINPSEKFLARIKLLPQIKFIVLTLDAPVRGKREADERFKARLAASTPPEEGGKKQWTHASSLTWHKTLKWLSDRTSLPIVLKGMQTWEDVYIAGNLPAEYRVRGIILSNHGGRALDTTTTPMHVLMDVHRFCPSVLSAGKLDILIDGGVKRGTDVVKALALGAKGVGIGRPALYGLSLGGEDGVTRVLEILAEETITAMKFLGTNSLKDLRPYHVNISPLKALLQQQESGTTVRSLESLAKSKI